MKPLDQSDQERLIGIAKHSIEAAVAGGRRHRRGDAPAEADLPPTLAAPAAAFVTLREGGELRGCIGLLRFDTPLWRNVLDAAAAAALDDPRFYAVTPDELPDLEVEVSVLEPPVEIDDPARFEAGRHGIVIEKGAKRGLLLPQVAPEMGWGNLEMLEAVCQKAHLPSGAWRDPEAHLYVFESTCFGDPHAFAAAAADRPNGASDTRR